MITIEYIKGLPIVHEAFLIEKYDSFFTTCAYIDIYFPFYDIYYLLVRKDTIIIDILIFGNKSKESICFNTLTSINQDIILQCSKKIFEEHNLITKLKISANYIKYNYNKSILISMSKNYVLELPSSIDTYYLVLGKSTRKNIRNDKSKLLRDFPNVKFITLLPNEINSTIINKIMQLNKDRMKHKGLIYGKDKYEMKNTYLYSKYYGCVTYIELEGEIIAGNISYIINKNIYGHVIAHDNNFSNYSLGRLCQLNTIQFAIENGLKNFHFLWGENEYKIRLMSKPQLIFSYYIFRKQSIEFFLTN